jgi:hypothetical protein
MEENADDWEPNGGDERIIWGMARSMSNTSDTIRYLPTAREAAWRRYLEAVRNAPDDEYNETEASAWDELQAALSDLPPVPTGAA